MIAVLGGLLAMIAAGASWARRRWVVVTVVGQSMVPTLRDGQRIVARRPRRDHRFAVGDVVVFRLPAPLARAARADRDVEYRVKRIAATGGDAVPDWLAGTERSLEHSGRKGPRLQISEASGPAEYDLLRDRMQYGLPARTLGARGAPDPACAGAPDGIARVPAAHFVVTGDAAGSEDSRHLGLVARAQVLAWLPRR